MVSGFVDGYGAAGESDITYLGVQITRNGVPIGQSMILNSDAVWRQANYAFSYKDSPGSGTHVYTIRIYAASIATELTVTSTARGIAATLAIK